MSRTKSKDVSKTDGKTASTSTPALELSKLDRIEALIGRPDGATLDELMLVTDWQRHSVRGALAGALAKRGLNIVSDKHEDVRRYRIGAQK